MFTSWFLLFNLFSSGFFQIANRDFCSSDYTFVVVWMLGQCEKVSYHPQEQVVVLITQCCLQ